MPVLRPSRLRNHLAVFATVLWASALVDAWTPTITLRTGQVKGTDFLHFYTLALIGATGHASLFANSEFVRTVQVTAVPESAYAIYPPAYGPQVSLLLAPLGHLSYQVALLTWLLITCAVYAIAVGVLWKHSTIPRHYRTTFWLAAVSFPPFWSLIMYGQLSIVALALFIGAGFALQKSRRVTAGLCVGLLIYKPTLFLPAIAILALAGESTIVAAAVAGAVAEVAVACTLAGPGSLAQYGALVASSNQLAIILSGHPEAMHSWRGFWLLLLPEYPTIVTSLFLVSAATTIVIAAICWRRAYGVRLRLSSWLVGVVLASPHLYTYDLVILMPVWIWLAEWALADSTAPQWLRFALYAGFVAPIVATTTGRVFPVQPSTICFGALLVAILVFGSRGSNTTTANSPWISWLNRNLVTSARRRFVASACRP